MNLKWLTVLRRIKEEYPGNRVLIYSNQPEEVYAISSLKAGASGYLNKKQSKFSSPCHIENCLGECLSPMSLHKQLPLMNQQVDQEECSKTFDA